MHRVSHIPQLCEFQRTQQYQKEELRAAAQAGRMPRGFESYGKVAFGYKQTQATPTGTGPRIF